MNMLPNNPLVYHDGQNIKAISFSPNDAFAIFKCVEMSEQQTKIYNHDRYFFMRNYRIWQDKLVDIENEIVLDYMDDGYTEVVDNIQTAWIYIEITLYPLSNRISFRLNRDVFKFSSAVEDLEFLVSEKHDPSQILHVYTISVDDLLREGKIVLDYPLDKHDISFYTRKLFDNYILEVNGSKLNYQLPPDHFFDLQPMNGDHGLISKVDKKKSTIQLIIKDEVFYDRSINELDILFTVVNDPTIIFETMTFSFEDLQKGVCVPLPKSLKKQPFQLWTSYYFHEN